MYAPNSNTIANILVLQILWFRQVSKTFVGKGQLLHDISVDCRIQPVQLLYAPFMDDTVNSCD